MAFIDFKTRMAMWTGKVHNLKNKLCFVQNYKEKPRKSNPNCPKPGLCHNKRRKERVIVNRKQPQLSHLEMKTRFITALIALLLCSAGIKTSAENNSTVIWGVKASVDAELPGKWHGDRATITMFSPGYGFTFGAVSNIYLGKNFYFEPGVSLFYSQYRYKDLYISVDQQEKDPKLYKCGVQVPIVFGYSFDFSGRFLMNLFTGPQIRYAFAGKIKINNSELLEELDSEFDLWGVNGQR